jgi:Uma2 family endonuclease
MAVEIIKRRFTVDDYQRMGQTGILSEDDRVELIDGEILVMSPIGSPHTACVDRFTRVLILRLVDRAIVRVQGSVRLDLYDEPEPDVALLRAKADFYKSGHPEPADILLLIEVADSSLAYDLEVKAPLYASRGVVEYWLVDLNDEVIGSYSDPSGGTYQTVTHHRRGESLAPRLLRDCILQIAELLP